MNKLKASALMLILAINCAFAQEKNIDDWLLKAPLKLQKPAFISGADIEGKEFSTKNLLGENYMDLSLLKPAAGNSWSPRKVNRDGFVEIKPVKKAEYQLAYLGFYLESDGLDEIKIEVESPHMFEVYLAGKKISTNNTVAEKDKTVKRTGTIDIDPGKYLIIVKSLYTAEKDNDWIVKASLSAMPEKGLALSLKPEEKMSIHHLLEGTKLSSMSLSPDGSYVAVSYSRVDTKSGRADRWTVIRESKSGKTVQSFRKAGDSGYRWMPTGNRIYYTERKDDLSTVMVYDFDKSSEYALIENITDMSGFTWSPDCSFIIY